MNEKTKIWLLLVGGFFLLSLTVLNFIYFSEKNKEEPTKSIPVNSEVGIQQTEELGGIAANEPEEALVYKSPQAKFDEMLNVNITLKMPTYFDKSEKNPIHSVSLDYPKESNHYVLTTVFIDTTSEKKVSYKVTTDKQKFEKAKNKGKESKLKNGITVYYYDSKYYWNDGGLYAEMGSLDFMTTNREIVLEIIESLSINAKYTSKDIIQYQKGDKILKPTQFYEENEHVTVSVQYQRSHDRTGKESVQVSQIYKHFDLAESININYVKDGFLSDAGVEEKQVKEQIAYFDTNLLALFYNASDRAVVFSPKSEEILLDDKYLKVLEAMLK